MNKIVIIITILACIFSFSGCSGSDPGNAQKSSGAEPGMIGYVMDKDASGRILVVDTVSQDFSSTGGVNEFYNAIWFSNVSDDIKAGDKVKVWYDIVAESYPGQSEALDIEIVPAEKPEGADLDESQAINKALNSEEVETDWPTVLKAVEYDKASDVWNLEIKDLFGDNKTFQVTIEDII